MDGCCMKLGSPADPIPGLKIEASSVLRKMIGEQLFMAIQ
jgi:hypothetical protein